jgi:amidase
MANTVDDLQALLDVLAGADGLDGRQDPRARLVPPRVRRTQGVRVGLLDEGFGWPTSAPEVDDAVRGAIGDLAAKGAGVRRVSIPEHRQGRQAIADGGASLWATFQNNGIHGTWPSVEFADMVERFARAWRNDVDLLPPTAKAQIVVNHHLQRVTFGRYWALSQRFIANLRVAFDRALEDVHVLVMPTTPATASALPTGPLSLEEHLDLAWEQSQNTRVFNATGHPVLNVPCGLSAGLPVGMSLVGRHGDDNTVLQIARLFEQIYQIPRPAPWWQPNPTRA